MSNPSLYPAPSFASAIKATSQDTFLNITTPLSVVENLNPVVDSITISNGGNFNINQVAVVQNPPGDISGVGFLINTPLNMAPFNFNVQVSWPITFQDINNYNSDQGQLTIRKFRWYDQFGTLIKGLGVVANSTMIGNGSFQPTCTGDLYINNDDSTTIGTGKISYVDEVSSICLSADGGVSMSTASISSINGIDFQALISTVAGLPR